MIGLRGPQAINAGDRGHDDDVLALQQRPGGGVAHAVNGFVDGRVLLDIQVGLGDVGFGLVIVVIGDEIFHRVVREKFLEFPVELGRQGLVGGQDQGGQVYLGNDVGYGESLAGARDPQEHLMGVLRPDPLNQFLNGLGLVPPGGKIRDQLEGVNHHSFLSA